MKTVLSTLLCAFLLLSLSCKKKKKASDDSEETTIEIKSEAAEGSDAESSGSIADCDEFLDEYEEWMDDYLAMMEKYKDNTMAMVSSEEYREMGTKAMEWTNQAAQLALKCSSDPDYEERMDEIQKRADKKMEELGL
ncbi:DUF6591 domain-containing protein [Poritiphilus flavus]|uniref:Lysozyme inhibitor LprI N-terminal domain-containing protein n=1 Tax=Poritiphilus flavus TaxID=2697053 RepID=A0A6L9EHR4_9FLAO|nr:DUF6591 domain-containing protein [Poritiphilus flavus]NAS14261.1 hypothetical protein [Poritiphilus flavus]